MHPTKIAAYLALAVAVIAAIYFASQLYQNVVLLKSSTDALDRANAQESQRAAELNYEYLLSKAHLLESEGKTSEAKKAYQDAANTKPLELPQPSNEEKDHPSTDVEYGVGGIALVALITSLALFGSAKKQTGN
jgi:hypothetical protein